MLSYGRGLARKVGDLQDDEHDGVAGGILMKLSFGTWSILENEKAGLKHCWITLSSNERDE